MGKNWLRFIILILTLVFNRKSIKTYLFWRYKIVTNATNANVVWPPSQHKSTDKWVRAHTSCTNIFCNNSIDGQIEWWMGTCRHWRVTDRPVWQVEDTIIDISIKVEVEINLPINKLSIHCRCRYRFDFMIEWVSKIQVSSTK